MSSGRRPSRPRPATRPAATVPAARAATVPAVLAACVRAALAVCAGCAAPRSTLREVPAGRRRVEEGKASWYGKEAHGGPTASGERFDMHQLTAAHKTLPLGTRVRVTN